MACPFFMPIERSELAWHHPARLPLGGGWTGHCTAAGHEGTKPTEDELREFCNLGYAANCSRLPGHRPSDAVRFSIARERDSKIFLQYVCEKGHHPGEYGTLEYDRPLASWTVAHPDPRIQKMAECYLQSYLLRKHTLAPAGDISS